MEYTSKRGVRIYAVPAALVPAVAPSGQTSLGKHF